MKTKRMLGAMLAIGMLAATAAPAFAAALDEPTDAPTVNQTTKTTAENTSTVMTATAKAAYTITFPKSITVAKDTNVDKYGVGTGSAVITIAGDPVAETYGTQKLTVTADTTNLAHNSDEEAESKTTMLTAEATNKIAFSAAETVKNNKETIGDESHEDAVSKTMTFASKRAATYNGFLFDGGYSGHTIFTVAESTTAMTDDESGVSATVVAKS